MSFTYFCHGCRSHHQDPADAGLGHRVLCLDCAIENDLDTVRLQLNVEIEQGDLDAPLAA